MNSHLTTEREAEVCAMYESGKALREVGAAFGISRSFVRKVLIRNGVKLRASGRPRGAGIAYSLLSEADRAEARMWKRKRKSWNWVIEHFRAKGYVFPDTVVDKKRHRPGRAATFSADQLRELLVVRRLTLREASVVLSLHIETVRKAALRHDISSVRRAERSLERFAEAHCA